MPIRSPNWSHDYKSFYFPSKDRARPKVDPWQYLRVRGRKELSLPAQLKLEWIIFYNTQAGKNVTATATHFGITRKSVHKWLKRFEDQGLTGLEESSRAPYHVRTRQITREQRIRIAHLRNRFPRYGKMKQAELYRSYYQEEISSWKIQKIIEEGGLYPDKSKVARLRRHLSQARGQKRRRITNLRKEGKINYLWHVDTVILTLTEGGYRYLLTAIDEVSKLAFARLYTTHSSRNARDFLKRLHFLTEQQIINIHSDNGSEFKKEFEEACQALQIPQWYSRPHTPKDNPVLERFNRTIQEEFVEVTDQELAETADFNKALTEWLVEYNWVRPHQTLDYKSPLQYLDDYYPKVSPMYSSSTPICANWENVL
jgi:transposase InsO family protein